MKPFARMILVSSLAFAGMIAYSDTPLRGSMIAINQSDFNFYNMRGYPDIKRAPLRWPYSLFSLWDNNTRLMCANPEHPCIGPILIDGVLGVGLAQSTFVGKTRSWWFVIDSRGTYAEFANEAGVRTKLAEDGINDVPILFYAATILDNFHKTGSCEPLFDNKTVSWPKIDAATIKTVTCRMEFNGGEGGDSKEEAELMGIRTDCLAKPQVKPYGKPSLLSRILLKILGAF